LTWDRIRPRWFIQATGPGFKQIAITAGPVMSNKRKGENYYGAVEDRAVEGKSHRGEQGREFPGC